MESQGKKKFRILLVDDDESLRQTLANTLIRKGMEVVEAVDGQSAKSILTIEELDLVLSDIRMPNLNGIELLHFIRRNRPIPVILMTGFGEISETKDAYELGAKGFLAKPFKTEELVNLIGEILKTDEGPPKEESIDHLFSRLRIEEFVTGKEINYDIHIRLSESKYVKIAAQGESIDVDRIAKYRDKKVDYLYLTKEDFRKYLGFTAVLADKVVKSRTIEHERKLKFLTNTTIGYIKDLYVEDVDLEQFAMASDLVLTTFNVMAEDPQSLAIFEALKQHSDYLYMHSMAVSLYSVLISKEVGWSSPRTCMRLAMCGLIHDIGKRELPKEIIEKPRPLLTPEEIKLLETHTIRGSELIRYLPGLPEDVAIVAAQHHEDCKGTGYPGHLTRHRTMPLSRLVAVANEFCRLTFPSPGFAGMPGADALTRLMSENAGRLDEEFLNGLYRVVHPESKKKR